MKRWPLFVSLITLPAIAVIATAQETSVNPGINESFQDPDPAQFVERFEKEGREVYDFRNEIIDQADFAKGSTIADVGAGTGLFTRLIAEQVGSQGTVIAVDIAQEFVDYVVQQSREAGQTQVRGQVCQPDSVALPAESIDAAFICDTYHHFEFPYKTMRSLWQSLKPNGRVVLVEFERDPETSSEWILGHIRADQKTFVEEIKRAGFEIIREEDFMKTSYFMVFEKSSQQTPEGHTTDSLSAMRLGLKNGTAIILDVREQREWDAGHLKIAELHPLSDMQTLETKGKLDQLKLPKDQIIYTHCRSGVRSATAAKLLRNAGYDSRALKAGYETLKNEGFKTVE